MEQATFAELEHDLKKRRTRRELFLGKMDGIALGRQPMEPEEERLAAELREAQRGNGYAGAEARKLAPEATIPAFER